MTGALVWQFVKKFWPLFVIVPLVFAILFMRNTITSRTAERDAAIVRVGEVTEANKSLNVTIAGFAQQRIDNDAIATAVAAKLGTNTVRLTETRTIIERAKSNDPNTRAWADSPLPVGVRQALRPDRN